MAEFEIKVDTHETESSLKRDHHRVSITSGEDLLIKADFKPHNWLFSFSVKDKAKTSGEESIIRLREEFKRKFGLSPFRVLLIKLAQEYGDSERGLKRLSPSISGIANKAIDRLVRLGVCKRHTSTLIVLNSAFVRGAKALGSDPLKASKTRLTALFEGNIKKQKPAPIRKRARAARAEKRNRRVIRRR